MEEQKDTSQHLYEDEHVFLTEEHELFLKEGTRGDEQKLCEVAEDQVEEKVGELRNTFGDLQAKVNKVLEDADPDPDAVAAIHAELKETVCIGNVGELAARLEKQQEDPIDFYRRIVRKAQDLSKQTDWPYVSRELDNLSHEWSDGPDTDSDEIKKLFGKFSNAVKNFDQRKEQHYAELDKKRKENLETRKRLLEEFEGIISNKTWTATRRVKQIKGQWNNIGALPSDKGKDFDGRFNELLSTFNDHKVDRLVQQRQKKERSEEHTSELQS